MDQARVTIAHTQRVGPRAKATTSPTWRYYGYRIWVQRLVIINPKNHSVTSLFFL
jgi:hypothetical protein